MQVLCEKAEQSLILQITVNPTINLKPFCTISTWSMSYSISCSEEFPVYLRTKSCLISKCLSSPSPGPTCGQSPVKPQPLNYLNIFSRIVGGRQVAKGSYPWQVSLRKPSLAGLWAASRLVSQNPALLIRAPALRSASPAASRGRARAPPSWLSAAGFRGRCAQKSHRHCWLSPKVRNAIPNFQSLRQKPHFKFII